MIKQKQLSLCIITKNDEEFFSDCLKDMKDIADEIMVVDLGSDDRTRELATRYGANLYQPKWEDDFSKIKNFCMEHASGKWVLFLQADEVISHKQFNELKYLLKNPCAEGYCFKIEGKKDKNTVSSLSQRIRLIRNRKNYRFRYRSFEYIPDEELYSLQLSEIRITHRSEKVDNWQKDERIRLLQRDLKEHPKDGYVLYLKGIELLNQRKYKESADCFEQVLQTFTGGYLYIQHLYKCLGICLLHLKRYKDSEKILTEGFTLFPNYNDLLILRAELFSRLGRNEEALNDLETCVALRKGPNIWPPESEINNSELKEKLNKIMELFK